MDAEARGPRSVRIADERAVALACYRARGAAVRIAEGLFWQGDEEIAIADARYVIGHWWIDELTSEDVIFVCNRDRPWVWLPMDTCHPADVDRWIEHFSWKNWPDRGAMLNDLEVALLVGMHLQRTREQVGR